MAKQAAQGLPVGIDDGRAYIKLYAGKGRQLKIRSSVKAGLHSGSSGIGGNTETESGAYETDGKRFTVGDRVDGEDTRFDDYDGSAINRVAVHHALARSGFSGKKVSIATGLPVFAYYSGGGLNTVAIEKKRALLAGEVISLNKNRPTAEIESNIVCSEALSAWLDDVLEDDGTVKRKADMTNPCGIVDFGGRTLDTLWLNPPDEINHAHSGSERIGVLDLFDLVETALMQRFDLPQVSRSMLESAVEKKVIKVFGQPHKVDDIVAEAGEEISDRVNREIQRRFGNVAELDRILFVGGGIAALPEIAKRYKNAIVVPEPEYANARGMYKFLRHVKGS